MSRHNITLYNSKHKTHMQIALKHETHIPVFMITELIHFPMHTISYFGNVCVWVGGGGRS